MALLSVRELSKAYGGVLALRGVSFELDAGERVAMIGPNGAGKTTCFNVLGGQAAPDAGDVRLDGRSLLDEQPWNICRRGIARTFQVAATFGSMSVRENVQMALLAHRRASGAFFRPMEAQLKEEAVELVSRVGMGEQAERPCAVLAYGDLKRVELAMALAGRPRVLLMDEPTAGMAPRERGALMALASRLAQDDRAAVLFTEHDMGAVFGFASRILVLHGGALVADGPPDKVRADPFVREIYLGET